MYVHTLLFYTLYIILEIDRRESTRVASSKDHGNR